jgi:hypothetical protein
MDNKSSVKDFNLKDYTWGNVWIVITDSLYNHVYDYVYVSVLSAVWEFGWNSVEVAVETSIGNIVEDSVYDHFEQNSLTTQDFELL